MAAKNVQINTQTCKNCGTENQPTNTICKSCEVSLFPEGALEQLNLNTWKCESCLLISKEESEICAGCKTSPTIQSPNYSFADHKNNNEELGQEATRIDDVQETQNKLKQKIELIKKCLERCGIQNYTDDKFPCSNESISEKKDGQLSKIVKTWLRPKHIVADYSEQNLEWTLFDNPKCTDVLQGNLGDCWLIADIATIAEKPYLLDRIFVTKKYNPQGIYGLQFFVDGEWTDVIVDDFFPCDRNGQLIFAQAKRKQLWVPLIEKALAKLHKNYSSLVQGNIGGGLSLLTGCPVEAILTEFRCLEERKRIFSKLQHCTKKGLMMSCCSGVPFVSKAEYANVGLRSPHGHIVTTVATVNDTKILRLRNVTGEKSWYGDWSEHSELWKSVPKELIPAEGIGGSDDGLFWISYDDFIKYFSDFSICYMRENCYEYRNRSKFFRLVDNSWEIFVIEVTDNTELDLHLQHRIKVNETPPFVDTIVIIFDEQWRVCGCTKVEELSVTVWNSATISAGRYRVYCLSTCRWESPEPIGYNFICHSSKAIKFTKIEVGPHLVSKVLLLTAVNIGEAVSVPLEKTPALQEGLMEEVQKGMRTSMYQLFEPYWIGRITAVINKSSTYGVYVKTQATTEYTNALSTRTRDKRGVTNDLVIPHHSQIVQLIFARDGQTCTNNQLAFYRVHDQIPFTDGEKSEHSPYLTDKSRIIHRLMPNSEIE